MFPVLAKARLNPTIVRMLVQAPDIASKARPGQFVILRVDEQGERFPLTIADIDLQQGHIVLIFQIVGVSTRKLDSLQVGEMILDVAGPLGHAFEQMAVDRVICVGGGVGTACLYPKAKACHQWGCRVTSVIGARSTDLLILKEELADISERLLIATDDGSEGYKGFVSDVLRQDIEREPCDLVIAVGPLPMMRACVEVTRPFKIQTIVSLNPIMVDGTGMCGGCRVSIAGENRFACVDGPSFDGHQVDFEELMVRQNRFQTLERHACQLHEAKCDATGTEK